MAVELSRSENSGEIPEHEYRALFTAVRRGDCHKTLEFLTRHPTARTAVLPWSWGTPLHNAVVFGHEQIVEELVQLMTEEELETTKSYSGEGWTALCQAARDNLKMVKCMVTKNKKLLGIAVKSLQLTPILFAAQYGRWDIVRYLYSLTPFEDLMPDKGPYGSKLLSFCLYAKQFVLGILQGLPSRLLDFLGINRIRELQLIHVRSRQILDCMFDVIKHLNDEEMAGCDLHETIVQAIENGIAELVIPLCKARPDLLFATIRGKNIFHHAVECCQEKVYSLIYGVGKKPMLSSWMTNDNNNILHFAGMLSPLAVAKLDRIPGAALQMQRERQWYKEVESIVVPIMGALPLNKSNFTAPKLFTETHKELHAKGEKWMKGTASSYTVVSTLIITIMFAAAFTVPGGNNQETGFPIFVDEGLFMVFIVSDTISLFSSATSLLMFLGILTSRYAEDDFLKSLPTKMIIGLSTLLISIATMMVAFSSALFIMLQDKPWITYPIIFLACVPVILFIWMQFPLVVEIFVSTYGGGIFDRKVKGWI